MKYRLLGKTGLKVSEVGFGAWAIGGNKYGNSYGPTDDNESLKAIAYAIKHSRCYVCSNFAHYRY